MAVLVVGTVVGGEFSFVALADTLAGRLGDWARPFFAFGLFAAGFSSAVTAPLAAAALFSATVLLAVRQRSRPIVSGREEMIGATAQALEAFSQSGQVRAHGEIWSAHAGEAIAEGQKLRIKSIDGLILEVEPIREEQ